MVSCIYNKLYLSLRCSSCRLAKMCHNFVAWNSWKFCQISQKPSLLRIRKTINIIVFIPRNSEGGTCPSDCILHTIEGKLRRISTIHGFLAFMPGASVCLLLLASPWSLLQEYCLLESVKDELVLLLSVQFYAFHILRLMLLWFLFRKQ